MKTIDTNRAVLAAWNTCDPEAAASYRRLAAIAAILSAPIAIASLFSALPAVDYDLEALSDVMAFLGSGEKGATFGRWSMLLDMLGYYLLIVPATLWVGWSLGERAPQFARLFAGCLLAYAFVGAVGAAILAATLPSLMSAYTGSVGAERTAIEVAYRVVTDAVHGGIWNLLEQLFAAVGWMGIGWMSCKERSKFSVFTMVLGLACLMNALGNIFRISILMAVGLYAYLLMAPTWAFWIGSLLLRHERAKQFPRLVASPGFVLS